MSGWNRIHAVFFVSGWKSRDSVPKLVDEYLNKEIMVDEFVTHTMPLDKVNEAFDLMHAGKRYISVVYRQFTQ